MKKTILYIVVICLFSSCGVNKINNSIKINWDKFVSLDNQKYIDLCQIDSISDDYIITTSYITTFGCQILKLNSKTNNILFENNSSSISSITICDSLIGITSSKWVNKSSESFLNYSNDLGKSWIKIKTPLEYNRNFLIVDKVFFITGNLTGTGHVFKSFDKGQTWNEINYSEQGFKDFNLLSVGENNIFATGFKTNDFRDNELLFWDLKSNKIKELIGLGGDNYIKIISKHKKLHGIIKGNNLKIYSFQKELLQLEEEFEIPHSIGDDIKNVYICDKFYIITAHEKDFRGKILSWITYNKGKNWKLYKDEEEYQLIYNSFGGLFMKDKENNILIGRVP